MQKLLFVTIFVVFSFLFSFPSIGSPAMPGIVKIKQPNGTVLEISIKGDEWFNWKEEKTGKVIIKNKASGYYEFARIKMKDGREVLAPSGVRVNPGMAPSFSKGLIEAEGYNEVSKEDLKRMRNQALEKRGDFKRKPRFK